MELESGLAKLCHSDYFNLREQSQPDRTLQLDAVLKCLNDINNWLLVLDNVDDKEAAVAVKKICEKIVSGEVIITARFRNWPHQIKKYEIGDLAPDAAIQYLLRSTADDRQYSEQDEIHAATIAQELGYLALALEQAAAYINTLFLSFENYLHKWNSNKPKILAWHDEQSVNYSRRLLITWNTSFEQLSIPARAMLAMLSWIAPVAFPRQAFETEKADQVFQDYLAQRISATEKEKDGEGVDEDEGEGEVEDNTSPDIEDTLFELSQYSLLNWEDNYQSIRMHRLIQEVSRMYFRTKDDSGESKDYEGLEYMLQLVNGYVPGDPPPNDVRSWPLWESLATHMTLMLEQSDKAHINDPTSRLMNEFGLYLHTRGVWQVAEYWQRRTLAIDEASYGSDHPSVAISLNNLTLLLKDTHRLAEAEPLVRRAWKILLRFHWINKYAHPQMESVANWYAYISIKLGNSEAEYFSIMEALQQEVLDELGIEEPQEA